MNILLERGVLIGNPGDGIYKRVLNRNFFHQPGFPVFYGEDGIEIRNNNVQIARRLKNPFKNFLICRGKPGRINGRTKHGNIGNMRPETM